MALLTAALCSKKTNDILVIAVALLIALHAAAVAVSAGRVSGVLLYPNEKCSIVGACTDNLCTIKCGIPYIGTCRFVDKDVECCCRPIVSSPSKSTGDGHQLVH